jgi:hypothetical protein
MNGNRIVLIAININFWRKMMKRVMSLLLIAAAVLIVMPAAANACWISITATNASGSETLAFSDAELGSEIGNVSILDGVIENLKIFGKADPEIGAEFGVKAGNSATTFFISSGLEIFAPITNPTAYASAGVTLTDRIPTGTAKITGLFANGKINQAIYNGSTPWANLVSTFSVSGNTFTSEEEQGNPGSPIVIFDTLTSIESNFYFTLSAKDSASGTSIFSVTPEPATIAMLGLGAMVFVRRRRK